VQFRRHQACNDHGCQKNTALAIARELEIYKDGNFAITGADLEKLSDEEC
jgi:magnesium-transporting ATPase (P-type)